MNPFGSYRSLLGNSTSAIMGAIEIYNKPKFDYRTECFVILLLNARELMSKAILSKHRIRIFEPKKRHEPYRTLTFGAALESAKHHFPTTIAFAAVECNIVTLVDYRNNAVHYYNDIGVETVLYGLAQTAIVNFREVVEYIFDQDIAEGVNINLLPLSFSAPPDPIQFIGAQKAGTVRPIVAEFLKIISDRTETLEKANIDTGRYLTVFSVKLESTKKINSADIIAGVTATDTSNLVIVSKSVDPNKSHPLSRRQILADIGVNLHGEKFNTYTFDALVTVAGLKANNRMCWKSDKANVYQYSHDLLQWLKARTAEQIRDAIAGYRKKVVSTKKERSLRTPVKSHDRKT